MTKKMLTLALVLVLVLSFAASCAQAPAPAPAPEPAPSTDPAPTETPEEPPAAVTPAFVNVATGGTGGTYYPLGGAIAKIFNENIEGVTANAQSTGASAENIGLVATGETEVAFVQNDVTYYAWTATETFADREPIQNIRGMAMLYPEVVQVIANRDSGITSIQDLAGKDVAVGAPGSGTEVNARQVLAEHGMTYDDLGKADYLSFAEAGNQLRDRHIDAAFVTGAIPTAAVTEVTTTSDIIVVPIEPSVIASLSEKYPFYTEVVVPGGSYEGNDEDVITTAVMAMLVVPEDLEEELVYQMTKFLFEKRDVIIETHARGNDIKLETALDGMPIELHPGAQRYYDEQGVQ